MFKTNKILRYLSIDQHIRALKSSGIATNRNILFNPTVPELYEITFLRQDETNSFIRQSCVSTNGAICAYSGLKTGRQPMNSRIVKDAETQKTVDWNKFNIPITPSTFDLLQKTAIDFINHKGRCIVVDGYAGWEPNERIKVRTYCTKPYHALFIRNMLIRPTQKEMDEEFTRGADMHIINAGEMSASKHLVGTESITALDLVNKKLVILGTQFAGEMKKAIFKNLNYIYPRKGLLSLHSSATISSDGNSTLMLGLSSTGKTSLALRSDKRKLIGDDEICWGNNGLFNLEGGIYAKVNGLNKSYQPQVFNAIKFGSVLENVMFYNQTRTVNYNDTSIATNARVAFPITHLPHAHIPAIGPHPTNIIMLVCDTRGVLPPVSKLTKQQALYHFLSGYSCKVVGTQKVTKIHEHSFSSCFGQAFLPLSVNIYAKIFQQKLNKHNPNIWLVNTGWTGGKFGIGRRMKLSDTVKIIDAINDGTLAKTSMSKLQMFNIQIPNAVPGIQQQMVKPELCWSSKSQYNENLSSLVKQFQQNFNNKLKGTLSQQLKNVQEAGPTLQ